MTTTTGTETYNYGILNFPFVALHYDIALRLSCAQMLPQQNEKKTHTQHQKLNELQSERERESLRPHVDGCDVCVCVFVREHIFLN